MKIDSFSIEGIHYPNEDSLSIRQLPPKKIIAVLADGMGGLTFGREAADLIVNAITSFVCEHIESLPVQDLLDKALGYADAIISQKSLNTHSKMGAAFAVTLINGNDIHYTWLGNVRIYLFDHDEVTQLTTDHTLDVGYGKHLLTRCIKGAGIGPDVPYQCRRTNAGNILFLCSDGLYKQIDINQLLNNTLPVHEKYEDDASLIKIVFTL